MSKLLICLIVSFTFLMCIEYVSETHSNGMPKVVKTYNGYGRLELTKESGYYKDGTKKYENSYYNGEVKNTTRWDKNGKRLLKSQNLTSKKSDWSASVISEMLSECMASEGSAKEMCDCAVDATVSEFTYEEYMILQNATEGTDIAQEMQERALNLMMSIMECAQ